MSEKHGVYNARLGVEAWHFQGLAQAFPNHFHDYYVLGLVEQGQRRLCCNRRQYSLGPGQLLLLAPGDSHGCVQADGGLLDYRGLHIPAGVMQGWLGAALRFACPVLTEPVAAASLRQLHREIMQGQGGGLALAGLLGALLPYTRAGCPPRPSPQVEAACRFMEQHLAERVTLAQLCRCTRVSKSTLLREFARFKGITPYAYLQNIRISQGRRLLRQGAPPVQAALATGFVDQSHFTNYFSRFTGLGPGLYQRLWANRPDNPAK